MRLRIFLFMSVALLGQALGQAEVLLKRGSDWRYLKGSQTPGDWRAADFDDSAWPSAVTDSLIFDRIRSGNGVDHDIKPTNCGVLLKPFFLAETIGDGLGQVGTNLCGRLELDRHA